MTEPTGKDAIVRAFDRLFDRAATKLNMTFTTTDKDDVRREFVDRFEDALQVADSVDFPSIPEEVLKEMETAIDEVSPAEVAGVIAVGPLARQVQQILQSIAAQAAEQRLVEHYLSHAEGQYGGN